MLHPHIPDDLKHFGKHLFATFLGLLMALGLEQWREHHHEVKLAEQALAGVETELRENLGVVDRQIARSQESIQTAETFEAYLGKLIAAKRQGRPLPSLPKMGDLGIAANFYSDAWETLKGLGALRQLSPDRARRISRAYLAFAALRQGLDNQPILRQIPSSVFLLMENPESLSELDPAKLEQIREGMQLVRLFFQWSQHELGFARKSCEAAIQP